MKKTVVLGASANPDRYSYRAIQALVKSGIETSAVGLREGNVAGVEIQRNFDSIKDIHTVTMYVGPENQKVWIEQILALNPIRVIFNPGTENKDVENRLHDAGIATEHACTLVLLATNQY
jgi:predicted CoA-binding protein